MTQPLIITPTPSRYTHNLMLKVAIFLAAAAFVFYKLGVFAGVSFVVLVPLAVFLILFISLKRSFAVSNDQIIYNGLFGAKTEINISDISHALYATHYGEVNYGEVSRILVVDIKNKKRVSLNGIYWSESDIKKVASLLKTRTKVEVIEERMTYVDVAAKYPEMASYVEKHPIKIGLIVAAVIVIVVAIIALIAAA